MKDVVAAPFAQLLHHARAQEACPPVTMTLAFAQTLIGLRSARARSHPAQFVAAGARETRLSYLVAGADACQTIVKA